MRRMGPSQIVNSDVLEASCGTSRVPPPTERHLRNSEHTVIPGHPTALLTLEDLPHCLRRDDHPRFAAFAVPNADDYAILAELAHIRPFDCLDLALTHARMDSPKDEIG